MDNFAGLSGQWADEQTAKIVVLPVPYDKTSWLQRMSLWQPTRETECQFDTGVQSLYGGERPAADPRPTCGRPAKK